MQKIVVTPDLVLKKLNAVNPTKAQGPDGIHPKILYEMRNELAEPLAILFNKSLTEGFVPEDWKQGQITPIYKKGIRSSPTNYRPVSLTSVVCKLLEGVIKDNVMQHLQVNDLISDQQHGFIPQKGCNTNLLESLENWLDNLENGESVDVFYLDFSKAFDRVPHKRLMSKLNSYGVSEDVHVWIKNFLNNRSQSVRVGSSLSESLPVISGVPQGSVIGPLLFVLYINDLPDVTQNILRMFADDSKNSGVANSKESETVSQRDLDNLDDWTTKWQMGFNLEKCHHMRFGNRPLEQSYHLTGADGTQYLLETVAMEKDLGVIMDRELSFQPQVDKVIKTANSVLGTIKRTFTKLDCSSFSVLYKSMVRTHLEYCQEVWSPYKKGMINALEKVQQRATKMVKSLHGLSYEDRLKELKLPTLKHRRLRGDIIIMYKVTHGLLRTSIGIPYSMTNRNLRGHPFKLEPARFSTKARRHFLTNRIVEEWNRLPVHVVTAPTLNSFKGRLDNHWSNVKDVYSLL